MRQVRFSKVESVGNDFVLVERSEVEAFTKEELRRFTIAVCERRFGVGSDGLLVAWPEGGEVHLLMFNPDGTEDFCGNGIRCAALYAHQQGWVSSRFIMRHPPEGQEPIECEIEPAGEIRTVIGTASFDPHQVPLDECAGELFMGTLELEDATLTVSAVTTGSTHTVIFTDELPHDREFFRMSRELEHHQLFPARTSIIWTQVVDENHLRIRIWERGVGETQGCGTGSSAAAVVYLRRAGRGGEVSVDNPGGRVVVQSDAWNSPITVRSRASILYDGIFTHL